MIIHEYYTKLHSELFYQNRLFIIELRFNISTNNILLNEQNASNPY